MAESNGENQLTNDLENLPSIFKEGLDGYNAIANSDLPTNSSDVQINVKRTMKIFEKATRLVSQASIFSKNESIEEMATGDIQFLLLPALLGSLSLKLTQGERKDIVDVAEIYFKDFLQRCNEYGLSNYQFCENDDRTEETEKSEFAKLTSAVNTRAHKIQRYREQMDLKSKLENLKKNMENEHVDEEIKRNYFLTMVKLYIHEAIDELNSINTEKPILEQMAKMKKEDKPQPKRQPPPPLKPIIITRDEVQKAVYGAGYPSLPTMTVQEFYDKRVADGIFPDPNKPRGAPPGGGGALGGGGVPTRSLQDASSSGLELNDDENEKIETEKLVDEDDEEYIERMRAKDEFKDKHRRGWGNRMNRS